MRLTKQTGHAIRALIHCTRAGDRLVKVAEIAADLGITQQNAFKIVHLLVKSGLMTAARGRSGGVRLARPATSIMIGEVVRAIETTHVEVDETQTPRRKGAPPMPINQVLDAALEAFIGVLDQHTLADMALLTPPGSAKAAAPATRERSKSTATKPTAAAKSAPRAGRPSLAR